MSQMGGIQREKVSQVSQVFRYKSDQGVSDKLCKQEGNSVKDDTVCVFPVRTRIFHQFELV